MNLYNTANHSLLVSECVLEVTFIVRKQHCVSVAVMPFNTIPTGEYVK